VPLRRVNQAFVIATSTKIDVSRVAVPESVNDAFFAAEAEKSAKGEDEFFALVAKKSETSQARKDVQASVDAAIVSKLDATLTAYLKSTFAITKGMKVHELKF
jgi:large subunit ribosomal protein L6e